MTPDFVAGIGQEAVRTALTLALPLVGAAFLAAIIVGIAQTVTQVQETTISFLPKLIAVFAVFMLTLPWMLDVMMQFTTRIFTSFPDYIK
ncbi:MAG: EscS/YscS/HrcS family type III secretion system export apparatus protein [Deltaproteobacteria bacterium RIFCSPLOWO2_02_FULL_53_8]|nr:MAG: EscS/YscS/HrcS family type III secretion system export apparatus protein [Deltaproteobacteria bacterium RIFCSPLOWO2_02_FULL_53_8]